MKNATLRQITVFATVAKHLHFTRAAEELGMTQPSVSMQVRQLEENLGVPLFEQIGKRVYLTDAGKLLYQHSRAISHEMDEAQVMLNRFKGISGGLLRISAGPTAKYFVPTLLAEFERRYPEVVIDLTIAGRGTLLERFADNVDDFMIVGTPPAGVDVVTVPFLVDPLVAIARPDHALAHSRNLCAKQLASEPFLLRELSSETRALVDRYFEQYGATPKTRLVSNSNEALKRGVLAGLGVAIVPRYSVSLELEVGRMVELDVEGLPLQRSWLLVHRQEKRFSGVAEAFRSFVLNEGLEQLEKAGVPRGRVRVGVADNTATTVAGAG